MMSPISIEIPYGDGALPAEHWPASSPCGVCFVFAHGAGAGRHSPFMRRYAAMLAARGIDVVTFDFPYMAAGRKLPDRPPVLEAAFRGAVDAALAAVGARATAVVVGGKSMGGRMATHLAAQPDAWRAARPLAGAVAFGYPLRPPGPRGGDRISHLHRLAVPTLIVQGTRDTFGGPDAVHADVGAAAHLTVLPVESGDHSLKVLASAGRRQVEVEEDLATRVSDWMGQAAAAIT